MEASSTFEVGNRGPRSIRRRVFDWFLILGVLIFVGGGACMTAIDMLGTKYSKVDTTQTMLSTVMSGFRLYHQRHSRFPTQTEGFAVLVSERMLDKMPKDGWGNDFVFELENGLPKLTSYGKDGRPGGTGNDADIVMTLGADGRETLH